MKRSQPANQEGTFDVVTRVAIAGATLQGAVIDAEALMGLLGRIVYSGLQTPHKLTNLRENYMLFSKVAAND